MAWEIPSPSTLTKYQLGVRAHPNCTTYTQHLTHPPGPPPWAQNAQSLFGWWHVGLDSINFVSPTSSLTANSSLYSPKIRVNLRRADSQSSTWLCYESTAGLRGERKLRCVGRLVASLKADLSSDVDVISLRKTWKCYKAESSAGW